MGDLRFNRPYIWVREAEDPVAAIRALGDEEVVAALAASAHQKDEYLANVLATEAQNRARRWVMVFGQLSEGILTVDAAGIVRFGNPRTEQLLGYHQGTLIGTRLDKVFETEPPGTATRALASAMARRETVHALGANLRRSGDAGTLPVDLSVTPMLREDEVEGAVLVVRDVSEREEAARRLAASEQRYRSLFLHNGDPVVAIDLAGTFTAINPAGERVLGYPARETVGRPFVDLVVPQDQLKVMQAFEQALGGSAVHVETTLRRRDGAHVLLDSIVLPIVVAGEVEGVYAIARDVTPRRRAEAELRHRQHVLVDLARSPALRGGQYTVALEDLLRASAATLEVARVGYWTRDAATGTLRRASAHPHDDPRDDPLELTPDVAPNYLRALEAERVIAAHDARQDPRTNELKEVYLDPLGIASILDAPVRVDGSLVGVLCHEHTGEPRTWTQGEQEFAAAAADIVAGIVLADDRRRDLEALQEAHEHIRLLLQHAPIVLFVLDADGRFLLSEGHGLRALGLQAGEVVGRSVFEIYADNDGIVANARRALAGEPFTSMETTQGHVFETHWTPVDSYGGWHARVVGVALDVTQTQQAMEALRESEERFRTLAEASFEPLLIHQDGRIVDCNRALLEMKGYEWNELVGRSVLDLIPPEQHEMVREHMRSSADASYELTGIRRDGTTVPLKVHSREVPYRGGRARVVALRDIRLEKAVERALSEQVQSRTRELDEVRDSFRCILEAAGEGLCGLDQQGRVTFLNPTGAAMLGVDAKTFRGQDFHHTVHSAEGPEETCPITRSYRDQETHRVEHDVFLRSDGTTFPVTYTSTPLVRDGKPSGAVIVFQETTERRRSQAQLRALNEELGRRVAQLGNANRELESFTYSVSHDLRAPLRGVSFYAQVLEEDHASALDEEGQRIVRSLRGETQRLSRLVDDLMTLSRANGGDLEIVDVDLTKLARSVADELRQRVDGREVAIVVEEDLRARGDAGLLRVALANLLGNAWKYSAQVEHPRVRVGKLQRDQGIVFFVADNGIGFEPADAGRLFQPFERLPGAAGFAGTGVGLSTVRRIIERHGGNVWAEGRPGAGATFFFTLPTDAGPVTLA